MSDAFPKYRGYRRADDIVWPICETRCDQRLPDADPDQLPSQA